MDPASRSTKALDRRPASFYQPVDESDREAVFADYVRFLAIRNGDMDFQHRIYSRREDRLAALAGSTARFDGPFDAQLWRDQYRRYDRRRETPAATQLLLLFCKINAGEAFGIEVMREARREYFERPQAQFQAEKIIANEEEYHTKLLVGATQYFGVEMNQPFVAPLALKVLIHGLAAMPDRVFHSVLLAAELTGLYALNRLLDAVRMVLKDQPQVRDAMEERLFDVLIDEVGHASYNRLALGSWGLKLARGLTPLIHRGVAAGPEARALAALTGGGVPLAAFDHQHLPEDVRRRAFFA
jgi:hypothetical protein